MQPLTKVKTLWGGVSFINILLQINWRLKSFKMIHEIRRLCFLQIYDLFMKKEPFLVPN